MKNLFLMTLTFAMVQFTFAQDQTILDGGFNIIDGAYEKNVRNGEIEPEEIPGYQYVREADVMWSTKISRVINLREKINQVFYYPQQEINDRKNLIDVLMDAINEGTITPYANAYKDDEFKTPMISDAEKAMIGLEGQPVDTIKYYDDELEEEIEVIVENKFEKENVRKYIIKEEWYFDKQRSVMDVRIIGICPLMDTFDQETGEFKAEEYLFWVYFPEARKVLAKAEVFNHRKNDAARLTYDDVFHKRMFSSFIIKESNKYNREISEYRKGIDALLEAEAIKEEIFNLEHDLWEY
jgi:gliding motility associated protien GldN